MNELLGKFVIVGVTRVSPSGAFEGLEQYYGRVESMDEGGIYLRLVTTGMLFRLPPAPEAFEPAEPGEYRLRSTSEIVTDPDFVATWTVQGAPPDLNSWHN